MDEQKDVNSNSKDVVTKDESVLVKVSKNNDTSILEIANSVIDAIVNLFKGAK